MDVQGIWPALGDAARFAVVEAVGTDVEQLAGDGRAVVDVVAGTQVQRPPGKQLAAVVDVVARTKAQAVAGADLSAVGDVFARIKADAVVGADVAAVVDIKAVMQCGDVDFCRAGEGAAVAEVVHPHLVACFAVDEAAVRDVRGVQRKVARDDAAAVGKALQQVQFEIHSADAAARAVQLRAVDGEFCCREQVAAF